MCLKAGLEETGNSSNFCYLERRPFCANLPLVVFHCSAAPGSLSSVMMTVIVISGVPVSATQL